MKQVTPSSSVFIRTHIYIHIYVYIFYNFSSNFQFIKPTCAHLMYTPIQFSVHCYMFRQTPATFRQSLHRNTKLTEVKISPIAGPRCPQGSRKFRFPEYVKMIQDGGKGVSLMHRPFLSPGNSGDIHNINMY